MVVMTVTATPLPEPGLEDLPIEELARRQGVRPIATVDELADPGVFESDAEVEEFLSFVRETRGADLA